jgi:alkylation response protein AidB-like acyl-CoA dehydrogenase
MRVRLDDNERAFREEVRRFHREHLPQEMAARVRNSGFYGGHRDIMAWSRILGTRGWAVPHWPVEHGGTGWTATQQDIFSSESRRAGAPVLPMQGPYLVGPILIAVGTDAQRQRFLPGIRTGTVCWCQGFSEPGAGSDLASLRTTAVRQRDRYVVTGQKLWTSAAHEADWGFFLVRTDPSARPQEGISFLLVDMKSPGVTVRPVILLNGEHHVNEVFLDGVEVSVDNLLGEENRGWHYAKTLLGAERTVSAEVYWSQNELRRLKALVADERGGCDPQVVRSAAFRSRVGKLEIELLALRHSVLRVLAGERNKYPEAAVASALKIRGSELMQRVVRLQVDALGASSARFFDAAELERGTEPGGDPSLWPAHSRARTGALLAIRATTIAGGAREVQKGIIAKQAFGL